VFLTFSMATVTALIPVCACLYPSLLCPRRVLAKQGLPYTVACSAARYREYEGRASFVETVKCCYLIQKPRVKSIGVGLQSCGTKSRPNYTIPSVLKNTRKKDGILH
jgi:hypothetical protein